jgi:hypothetical protein
MLSGLRRASLVIMLVVVTVAVAMTPACVMEVPLDSLIG